MVPHWTFPASLLGRTCYHPILQMRRPKHRGTECCATSPGEQSQAGSETDPRAFAFTTSPVHTGPAVSSGCKVPLWGFSSLGAVFACLLLAPKAASRTRFPCKKLFLFIDWFVVCRGRQLAQGAGLAGPKSAGPTPGGRPVPSPGPTPPGILPRESGVMWSPGSLAQQSPPFPAAV